MSLFSTLRLCCRKGTLHTTHSTCVYEAVLAHDDLVLIISDIPSIILQLLSLLILFILLHLSQCSFKKLHYIIQRADEQMVQKSRQIEVGAFLAAEMVHMV